MLYVSQIRATLFHVLFGLAVGGCTCSSQQPPNVTQTTLDTIAGTIRRNSGEWHYEASNGPDWGEAVIWVGESDIAVHSRVSNALLQQGDVGGQLQLAYGTLVLDGVGELSVDELNALQELNVSPLGPGLRAVPLDLACESDARVSPLAMAALLAPYQAVLKYLIVDRGTEVQQAAASSACRWLGGDTSKPPVLPDAGLLLNSDTIVPRVYGVFPFDEAGAAENDDAASGRQPPPPESFTGQYEGVCGKCRGACGRDCVECSMEVDQFCEAGVPEAETTFECKTHDACRVHDDCYDHCAWPGGPLICNRGRLHNFICQTGCGRACVDAYDFKTCFMWAFGGEAPHDEKTLEFTSNGEATVDCHTGGPGTGAEDSSSP